MIERISNLTLVCAHFGIYLGDNTLASSSVARTSPKTKVTLPMGVGRGERGQLLALPGS